MNNERLWSATFVVIIACTLCCFLVGQGANAGTTVYLERIGGDTGIAGVGALVFSLAAAVSRIVSGPLADARGRRIVMLVGAFVMVIGTVGPLLGNSDVLFIIWRFLQGFGFAACTTATATAAADVLPLSRLGAGIGYYGLGQAIAMSCGPALAIFLISTNPPENFYFGLSVCAVLAVILSWACTYEKHPAKLPETSEFRVRWEKGEVPYLNDTSDGEEKEGKITLRGLVDGIVEPAALPGTIPMMLIATSFGFGIFFMGVYGNWLGVANSGIFYTVAAISMIAIRLTSGKFMDKVRPIFIMGAAVIAGLVCFSMMLACSLVSDVPEMEYVFYAAGIPYGLSLGMALPINQTVAVRLSPPSRWGAANGLYMLGNDVAIGFASLMWGFMAPAWGYTVTIGAVMVCIAASFFAALICYPKEKV